MDITWIQHPVGHGGFHTGVALHERQPFLRWAFDCGSRKETHLKKLIASWLHRHPGPIDWLFVSHFDTDHANGIDCLMGLTEVRNVMVPYVHAAELAFLLLEEIGRGRTTSDLVQLIADPAGYFTDRGAQTIYVLRNDRDRPDRGESLMPEDPDPTEGRRSTIKPRPSKWTRVAGALSEAQANIAMLDGGEVSIVEEVTTGFGIRFSAFCAPLDPTTLTSLLDELKQLVGATIAAGDFGLGSLAHRIAAYARTPAGRAALRAIYRKHVGSSNRSSLSVLSVPIVPNDSAGNFIVRTGDGEFLRAGTSPPAWLNTGDAELRPAQDLTEWNSHYAPDLASVQVLAVPHHGSDHNSDDVFQALCPPAVLTAHCTSTSTKHPGSNVILTAGPRLRIVSEIAASAIKMDYWFPSQRLWTFENRVRRQRRLKL